MSFFRPEAVAAMRRWRGALAAGAVTLAGLWWALAGFGLIRWFGAALALAGAMLLWAAVQRARFRGGAGGIGVVEIDERQIAYLAPLRGGILSIDNLTAVAIAPDSRGQVQWQLRAGIELLTIPAAAEGTEGLFDVLTALPGADIEAAIRASASRPDRRIVIWESPRPASH